MKELLMLAALAAPLIASFSLAGPARGEEGRPAPKTMKPVLLVIDVQNAYLPYMSELDVKKAPDTINGAIWLFREHDLPIIRVYNTDPKWGPAADSPGFQFAPAIHVKDDDPKVIKNYPNSFKKTELQKMLQDRGINTVFVCGLSATGCVLATYMGAQDLDYTTFMIKDALISPDTAHTRVIQEACESVSFTALQFMLENMRL